MVRADVEKVPLPIVLGPEVEAMARFYQDSTWEGRIHEGGMGPGTPPMKGVGRATFRTIQDGRWFVGDFEQDQFLDDGTFVLKWGLHWVSGWAPQHGEYRASMADNYGNTDVYRGYIEGDRLVFESMPNAPLRLRFTWDASDPTGHHVAERDGVGRRLVVPRRGVSDDSPGQPTDASLSRPAPCDAERDGRRSAPIT